MNFEEQVLGLLGQINGRLDTMDGRLDRLETTQAKQGEQLTQLTEKVDRLETVQAEQGELLKELDARSLKSAVLLETDVPHELHLLYEGHKTMLDTLATKEQVEELASEVDVIKKVVSGHSREISKLKKAQ